MSISVLIIDGEDIRLVGEDKGRLKRKKLDFDDKDTDNNTYILVFPRYVSSSFIDGLLRESIYSMDHTSFNKKYIMDCDHNYDDIKKEIDLLYIEKFFDSFHRVNLRYNKSSKAKKLVIFSIIIFVLTLIPIIRIGDKDHITSLLLSLALIVNTIQYIMFILYTKKIVNKL
jgi:hypothetical protein